jgi:hypothetical protein
MLCQAFSFAFSIGPCALVVLSKVLLVVGYWPKQMAPPPTESQEFLASTDLRESLRGDY